MDGAPSSGRNEISVNEYYSGPSTVAYSTYDRRSLLFLPPHCQGQEGEYEGEGHAGDAGDHARAEVERKVAAAVAADDGERLDLVAVEAEANPLRLREGPLVHPARVVDAAGGAAHAHHVLLVGPQPLEQDLLNRTPRLMNDPSHYHIKGAGEGGKERGGTEGGRESFLPAQVGRCV